VYDFINDNPSMESYASAYVSDIHIIKQHDYMMSVNTAIEVDLYGRVNAEFNGHQYSGSGGQFDFVKGASFSKGGKSFIASKSSAKNDKFPASCHGCKWLPTRAWTWSTS
jgi:itaconate CoA-transferase